MGRFVIKKGEEYVKSSIITMKDDIEVKDATFTKELNEAEVFDDFLMETDVSAWEIYFGTKHGDGFIYQEIVFVEK